MTGMLIYVCWVTLCAGLSMTPSGALGGLVPYGEDD